MITLSKTQYFPRQYSLEDVLGLVPYWLDESDPRSAEEQLNAHYAHGGGWSPLEGWKLSASNSISYPGDSVLQPWAIATFREDTICAYESAWFAIIHPDRTFSVARMD